MLNRCSQKCSHMLRSGRFFRRNSPGGIDGCCDVMTGERGAKRRAAFTRPIHYNSAATISVKIAGSFSRPALSRSKIESLHRRGVFCYTRRMPSSNDSPELLTLPEAAARLRRSRRTLERLIAAKEFPAPLKIGSGSLIPLADVEAFIERLMAQRNRRAST